MALTVRGNIWAPVYEKLSEGVMKNFSMHGDVSNRGIHTCPTLFLLYEGSSDWSDLSKKLIERGTVFP